MANSDPIFGASMANMVNKRIGEHTSSDTEEAASNFLRLCQTDQVDLAKILGGEERLVREVVRGLRGQGGEGVDRFLTDTITSTMTESETPPDLSWVKPFSKRFKPGRSLDDDILGQDLLARLNTTL